MYTAAALLDMHLRCQRSLRGLIAHCASLSADELRRELAGFGYPSVAAQFAHVIGAQEYWIGVLRGSMEGSEPEFSATPEIEAFRARVAGITAAYMQSAHDAELNTPRGMITWPQTPRTLTPAHVVLRTFTHIFDHKGQISAMCRMLGKPIPAGLDFPLV